MKGVCKMTNTIEKKAAQFSGELFKMSKYFGTIIPEFDVENVKNKIFGIYGYELPKVKLLNEERENIMEIIREVCASRALPRYVCKVLVRDMNEMNEIMDKSLFELKQILLDHKSKASRVILNFSIDIELAIIMVNQARKDIVLVNENDNIAEKIGKFARQCPEFYFSDDGRNIFIDIIRKICTKEMTLKKANTELTSLYESLEKVYNTPLKYFKEV